MNNYFVDFYVDMLYGASGIYSNWLVAILVPLLAEDLHFSSFRQFGLLLLKIVGSVVAMNLLCALSYIVLGHYAMSQVCGGILVVLYMLLFSKSAAVTKVAYGCSFFASIAIVFTTCFSVFDLMTQIGATEIFFFGDLLLVVLMIACVFFFRAFSPDKLREPVPAGLGILCVVCAVCTAFWLITNFFSIHAIVRFTVGLMLLALLLAAYYSLYAISRAVERTNTSRMSNLLREADENMLGAIERNMEALRRARHEFGNQYMYMKELLQAREYEKLDQYFTEYSEKMDSILSFVDCGNRVVNAVMNMELQKAAKNGITIAYELNVPAETGFSDCDFCSLLFNVLNNAIEYLCRRPEADRTVRFSLRMENRTLFLSCENAIEAADVPDARLLRTSKADAAAHGYGSKVVRAIAERYNGSVEYEIKTGRGVFSVSAMLFEPERPAGEGEING